MLWNFNVMKENVIFYSYKLHRRGEGFVWKIKTKNTVRKTST
jgi:hypothetical protein